MSTKLIHLARLWFLSDLVKMCQVVLNGSNHYLVHQSLTSDDTHFKVESLFRAGLDYLALELRPGIYINYCVDDE